MREQSTISVQRVNGIEFLQYNSVPIKSIEQAEINGEIYDGFYISYNNHDIKIYGDRTTALVLGQMQKFYILKGDHREQYSKLIEQGFSRCLEYFKANAGQISKYSDRD
jgi:hypothetical protein